MRVDCIQDLIRRYPQLAAIAPKIKKAGTLLLDCTQKGGTVFLCGNGGSAADAEHIVGELMKGFLVPRPLLQEQQQKLRQAFAENGEALGRHLQRAVPAVSLVSGVALPTAFANDVAAEYGFAQQIFGLGRQGDVLWGLSTSGKSVNIIHAFRVARAFGLKTLGLTGRDGGDMAPLCDVEIRVPAVSTPEIQELHLPVYHALCAVLEQELFG